MAFAAAVLLICFAGAMDLEQRSEDGAYVRPATSKIELGPLLNAGSDGSGCLSEEDYRVLLDQTGLSKLAIDELLEQGADGIGKILGCQSRRYSPMEIECRKTGVVTWGERLNLTQQVNSFLPDLKDGDILVSKNSHTIGWRHGHAALVVDAEKGRTLECVYWGEPSCVQKVSKWKKYPSFALYRLKDAEKQVMAIRSESGEKVRLGDAVANYAKEHLEGVDYGLLAGAPVKAPKEIKKSQCAHLVWYSFKQFGYDLDSDGSWLVTPKDLANSDQLELVQVFGADPDHVWD